MKRVMTKIVNLLDFSVPANALLDQIRAGYAAALASGRKKTPKDPLAGFHERSLDTQCKIVINSHFGNFAREVAEIFQAEFVSVDIQSDALISDLKSMVMALKPWIPPGAEGSFTDDISTDHALFQPLVLACLGQSVAR
eukprot:Skav203193  [mRNA]  locus=scaffold3430:36385:36801:+ [translate_table: standard]